EYGIDPEEVTLPGPADLVGDTLPHLSTDRIDYGLTGIHLWVPPNETLSSITIEDFHISEDRKMFMTDKIKAKAFAEAFLELSREHWSEPVHRLQLEMYKLLLMGLQRTLIEASSTQYNPRDLMYTSYEVLKAVWDKGGEFIVNLDELMRNIARREREVSWRFRKARVEQRLSGNGKNGIIRPSPYSAVSIKPLDEYSPSERAIPIQLNSLKLRQVDPTILVSGEFKPLSVVDEDFAQKLAAHKQEMAAVYMAELVIADKIDREKFRTEMELIKRIWPQLKSKQRIPKSDLGKLIEAIANGGGVPI